MFFPADLLANTEETSYRIICRRGKLIACTEMAVEFNHCKANLMFLSEY